MAELADAYGSGPYESNFMQVQVLLSAPYLDVSIDTSRESPVFLDSITLLSCYPKLDIILTLFLTITPLPLLAETLALTFPGLYEANNINTRL